MVITFKNWFIFSSSAALLVCNLIVAAENPLHFSVTPDVIQMGERAIFEVRILADANSSPATPPEIHDDFLTQNKTIQILNKEFKTNGPGEYVWRYEITSYRVGTLSIPPVEIQYGPNSLSTERSNLEVTTSRSQTDETLREEFGKINAPIDWRKWAQWIFFSSLAGILFAAALAFIPKPNFRKARPAFTAPAEKREDNSQWLRRQLNGLKIKLNETEVTDGVVDELTLILREYFEREGGIPGRMWTTREFGRYFAKNATTAALVPIFERCDRFKFGRERLRSAKENALLSLQEAEQLLSQLAL
jgi:hypothetical protein